MFKKLLLVLLIAVAAFAGYVAMQPNDFRIARTATIAAPPATVFAQVNDFHNWAAWSPWAKLDPNAKHEFLGSPAGKDAVHTWDGNNEVGKGKMTIVESKPNELIRIRIEFEKPMQDASDIEFTFKPSGEKTDISWTMSGDHTFVSKAVCTLMNMDKVVGEQFEQGLASMQKIVEAKPAAAGGPALNAPAPGQAPATGGASNAAEPPDPVGAFKK